MEGPDRRILHGESFVREGLKRGVKSRRRRREYPRLIAIGEGQAKTDPSPADVGSEARSKRFVIRDGIPNGILFARGNIGKIEIAFTDALHVILQILQCFPGPGVAACKIISEVLHRIPIAICPARIVGRPIVSLL